MWGPRVRISVGMLAWLAVAVALIPAVGEWRAAAPLALLVAAMVSTAVRGAHAWAAHRLGYEVGWVVLGSLAGMTAYLGRDDRPLERAAVALAGPAASAAVVLALLAARVAVPDGAQPGGGGRHAHPQRPGLGGELDPGRPHRRRPVPALAGPPRPPGAPAE